MKSTGKKFVLLLGLWVAGVAVALAVGERAAAQQAQPVAVISIAGYDALVSDVKFIGKLVDKPALHEAIDGMIALVTQGQGLKGLDKSRPWGALVYMNEQPEPLAFVPVTDFKGFSQILGMLTGAPAKDLGEGVFELPGGKQKLFLKEQGSWAFVAANAEGLANLPNDPLALLGGLEKQYDLALRIKVQNIPQPLREFAIDSLKQGAQEGLAVGQPTGEDEETFKLRKQLVEKQIEQLATVVNETDQVTLGWKADAENNSVYLDVATTAVPGSKLARQAAQMKDVRSNFAGFLLPDAAIRWHFAGSAGNPEDIGQLLVLIDAIRNRAMTAVDEDEELPDDASREIVKSALGDAFDVLKATLEEGFLDGGAVATVEPNALNVVFGGRVSDGARLESAVKKLLRLAEQGPDFEGVKWNAENHQNVRIHTLSVPLPEDADEGARRVFGDQIGASLGVGEKSFFVALGSDHLALLKTVLDKSQAEASKTVPPTQAAISVGQLLKFAAAADPQSPQAAILGAAAREIGENDHVNLTVQAVPNGSRMRIEIESGVLKLIGKAGQAMSALGAGGAPPVTQEDF